MMIVGRCMWAGGLDLKADWVQVINCEKQPEGCTADGEAESVFDVEKERLVHSLFRLLQATAGTAAHRRNGTIPRPPTLADYMARHIRPPPPLLSLQTRTL